MSEFLIHKAGFGLCAIIALVLAYTVMVLGATQGRDFAHRRKLATLYAMQGARDRIFEFVVSVLTMALLFTLACGFMLAPHWWMSFAGFLCLWLAALIFGVLTELVYGEVF